MKVAPERLVVALHGVGSEFHVASRAVAQDAVAARFNIKGPFVLYVGKVQKLKNITRLIQAFLSFRQSCCPEMQLVLAGKVLQVPPALRASTSADGILRLGHVDPTDIPDLYRAAEMLVFPSLFESFGLPIIEAMRCGTPVICSNAGAMPEICGDAAYLVDPTSTDAIAQAMEAVFLNPELRQSLIERGLEHSKRYSWHETARQTLAIYKAVHESARVTEVIPEALDRKARI
jgi:glycosyltransferase involved in cell wall biosynthesis